MHMFIVCVHNSPRTTSSSQRYVNLRSHCWVVGGVCVCLCVWGWGGWWGQHGWEWIRMATQVAQLLLKGLFITVRSLLAPSPPLLASSVLTRPHLNNGPNTKKHVVYVKGVCVCSMCVSICVYMWAHVEGVELHIPLIFRSASLLIKAAITT